MFAPKSDLFLPDVDQIPLVNAILLHLIPGLLIVLFDFIFFPIVESFKIPALFTLILGNMCILIPVELGILLYYTKKNFDSFNILKSIPLTEKIPILHLLAYVLGLLIWGMLIFMLFVPITSTLSELFNWMPQGFLSTENDVISKTDFKATYSSEILLVLFVLSLLINGIAVPIIEEFYFRGFLLPRISRYLIFAPVLNVLLWSMYHFWAPWTIIANIIVFIPVAYVVLSKRNVYISILGHSLSNIFLVLSLVPFFF